MTWMDGMMRWSSWAMCSAGGSASHGFCAGSRRRGIARRQGQDERLDGGHGVGDCVLGPQLFERTSKYHDEDVDGRERSGYQRELRLDDTAIQVSSAVEGR